MADSPTPSLLSKALERYLASQEALRRILPAIMSLLSLLRERTSKEYNGALDKYGTKVAPSPDGTQNFHVPIEHDAKVARAKKKMDSAQIAIRTLPRTFLVQYVSEFDAFMGDLLRALYTLRPELLMSSQRQLTFAELSAFQSIEEARSYVVEKEVESFLRESHRDQFAALEKKFDVPLTKGLSSWPTFVELTERRNLFVHCAGVVSRQYLTACKAASALPTPEPKIGDQLHVTPKYLRTANQCLCEIATKLVHVLWRKLFPGDRDTADKELNKIAYSLLVEGRNEFARELLEFAVITIKQHSSEENKRILVINLAQAYYHLGNSDKAKGILSQFDWTATAPKYRLGVAVLKDEFDQAKALMGKIPADHVREGEYLAWPLFKTFRKTQQFHDGFVEKFGKAPAIEEEPAKPTPDDAAPPTNTVH